MYCKKCGGKIESYASNCPFCGEPIAHNSVEATYTSTSNSQNGEHKSIGSWILTYIVTCIPFIGFIMLFVWAFGDKTRQNPTFRNWAKSQLLIMVLAMVLSTIMLITILPIALEALEELAALPIQ